MEKILLIHSNLSEKEIKDNIFLNKKIKEISEYKISKIYKDDYKIFFSDIETIIENNNHKLVCISIINDLNEEFSFNNIKDYMEFVSKFSNIIIYFHNFGKFDSNFILNYMIKVMENSDGIEIIERNNIIYEIVFKNNIRFRDSFLLIPLSLKKIGETFCVNFKKDNFEYDKINEIFNNNYKLIEQLCIKDCKVLKEGFEKYSNIIKDKFKIDLYKQLTLPALSFNIFKYHYYNKKEKPISKNPYYEDLFIRKSYKGGISEVYKPYLENGYCYDVNSLYPFVMMNEKYPIGEGKFISGEKIDLTSFIGFIKCRIICDNNLDFLPYRHHEQGLITPIGEWIDTYTHKEVIKALELGYKISFLEGFQYKKEDYIFKDFVLELYKLRKQSGSKEIDSIVKLILNSLYGRFGMKNIVERTKFIKGNELEKLKKYNEIIGVDYLGNNFYIVRIKKECLNDKQRYAITSDTETAVQIASYVTAYSRIFMYKFKNLKDNRCYYTDTDSIFLEKKLDEKYISSDLGMFKLEYKVKKGYFIGPKVYIIEKDDNEIKVVIKGLKKDEYNIEDLIENFKNIIENNEYKNIIINRINKFKRNFKNLTIGYDEIKIIPKFPFNKRKKIILNNKWVDTEPLKIKDLSDT